MTWIDHHITTDINYCFTDRDICDLRYPLGVLYPLITVSTLLRPHTSSAPWIAVLLGCWFAKNRMLGWRRLVEGYVADTRQRRRPSDASPFARIDLVYRQRRHQNPYSQLVEDSIY